MHFAPNSCLPPFYLKPKKSRRWFENDRHTREYRPAPWAGFGVLPRSQSSMLWFYVLVKIRCQAPYQIFLNVCFLNLKCRTHIFFFCVWKYRFLFLLGFGSHKLPQPPVTISSRMLSCLIFDQIFTHIHGSLSINNIQKLSNNFFAELFNLQTL